MLSRLPSTLTALAVVVLVGAGPASAARAHHTAAGDALARAALLRRGDFGRGWSEQAPPPAAVPSLTCPQFKPAVSGAVEIGAAASPTFQASRNGPFVSDIAHTYATVPEETASWRAIARPGLLRCAAASLRYGGAQGVHFTVTDQRRLTPPALSVPSARYRVSGTASLAYQTIDVHLDMLVMGRGQTIVALVFSSFVQPPSQRLELRLARAVARKMSSR